MMRAARVARIARNGNPRPKRPLHASARLCTSTGSGTGLRTARRPRRPAVTQARADRLRRTSVDPDLASPDMAAASLPPRGAHRATKARFASRATCAAPPGTHGAATRVTAALPSSARIVAIRAPVARFSFPAARNCTASASSIPHKNPALPGRRRIKIAKIIPISFSIPTGSFPKKQRLKLRYLKIIFIKIIERRANSPPSFIDIPGYIPRLQRKTRHTARRHPDASLRPVPYGCLPFDEGASS